MKTKNIFLTLALALCTTFAFAQISGTAHDFSDATANDGWMTATTNQMCESCHTAHNAVSENGPLWNHTETAVLTYTEYTSPFNTLDGVAGQPGAASKLCLSCHDGTVALDAYGGAAGGAVGTFGIGAYNSNAMSSKNFGTTLANDHPVGITYTDATAGTDGGLKVPSTDVSGLGSTIQADMIFGTTIECASCHDVHGGVSGTALLLKSNVDSALCLTCHIK